MNSEERQPPFEPSDPDKVWGYERQPLPAPEPPRPRLLLHAALFLATVVTTVTAGAMFAGVNPFLNPSGLYKGIPFSFTLLLILGAHEMGHYLMSRRHHLNVTLPFFIPAPPFPFIIGTLGAFIRIRSPIKDKRALLDVGCAGPLTGVVVSIPVILVGLKLSTVQVIPEGGLSQSITFGEPLLFQFLSYTVFGSLPPDHYINLDLVGFAGWIGLFVTALNLIPVGQMDGGHVAYALFPNHHRQISWCCLALLLVGGLFFWPGWLVWALLLYLLGMRHPPPSYDWVPLDRRRKILGAITILVFILTFTPTPFKLD
ncbi:MAG: site-2 protease family protein [Deltaproteobacteria bacterium]|nr:MAG: site-2 protease family protein [Deltaproteobacteria bacterium]